MLRADEVVRVDARPRVTANVGALLYRCAVDELKVLAPADDLPRPPAPPRSLSPSRAADFMTCPLLYRFRVIDRLPEPPSPAAARGTLVHAVLERLFDEPPAGRTPATARALLAPQWDRLLAEEPELAGLFDDDEQRGVWLAEARDML